MRSGPWKLARNDTSFVLGVGILIIQCFVFLLIMPQLLDGATFEMATVGSLSYFCETAGGFCSCSRNTARQRQRICALQVFLSMIARV